MAGKPAQRGVPFLLRGSVFNGSEPDQKNPS
jgi:hypothetical protein